MWACPKCGVKFVNRNQWHSCGRATLDDWLGGLGSSGMALYRRFVAGPVRPAGGPARRPSGG